uniref:C2H2-type domain-containing protein n=1 Tax=Acrobeloides nanus TaxID=290746 RepID=A0A914D561_9BILA
MKDDKFHRSTTAECLFCSENLSGNALLIHLQVEHPTYVLGSDINQSHNLDKTVSNNFHHVKKKKHQCPYCAKTFIRPSDLVRHLRVHIGEKQYLCEKCQRSFTYESNLKTHLQTHNSRNPTYFKCGYCSKNFLSNSALRLHIRIHTNESPFTCDFPECNELFRTNKLKLTHIKKFHLSTPEKQISSKEAANQMLSSIKSLSKSCHQKILSTSQNSAFSIVRSSVNNTALMDHFQVVFRVQLRCGSASVIPGVMTHHSPTDIIIEISTLRSLSKDNYAMRIPLKKSGVPDSLQLILDPQAILMRLETETSNMFSFIVYPFPTVQVGPAQPLAIQIAKENNVQPRQLPSFVIECFLQRNETFISAEVRQTLAQSCLDFAERF